MARSSSSATASIHLCFEDSDNARMGGESMRPNGKRRRLLIQSVIVGLEFLLLGFVVGCAGSAVSTERDWSPEFFPENATERDRTLDYVQTLGGRFITDETVPTQGQRIKTWHWLTLCASSLGRVHRRVACSSHLACSSFLDATNSKPNDEQPQDWLLRDDPVDDENLRQTRRPDSSVANSQFPNAAGSRTTGPWLSRCDY